MAAMTSPPKPPSGFVNLRGEPLDMDKLAQRLTQVEADMRLAKARLVLPPWPAPPPKGASPGSGAGSAGDEPDEGAGTAPVALAPADLDTVWDALCLAGCARNKTWLNRFLRALERRTAAGAAFDAGTLNSALQSLKRAGRVHAGDNGLLMVPGESRVAALPQLLVQPWARDAWRAWTLACAAFAHSSSELPHPHFSRREEVVALARLLIYSGLNLGEFVQRRRHLLGPYAPLDALAEALSEPFMPEAFEQTDPAVRSEVLLRCIELGETGSTRFVPVMAWVDARFDQAPQELHAALCYAVAEARLDRADAPAARRALEVVRGPATELLRNAVQVMEGDWAAAAAATPELMKQAAKNAGAKRGLASSRVLRWLLLALLSGPDPKQWVAAYKLSNTESGSRTPYTHDPWGMFAHAVAVRLGDVPLDSAALAGTEMPDRLEGVETLAHRLVLAAWLGQQPTGWTPKLLAEMLQALEQAGLLALAALTHAAASRLDLEVPAASSPPSSPSLADPAPAWAEAFFGHPRELWRDALAAIEALGGEGAKAASGSADATPLQWQMTLDSHGRVLAVLPFEQIQGVRGLGKPKPVSLTRLKKAGRLRAVDAAVARCLTAPRWSPSRLRLDLASAVGALVGHPNLVFADALQQTVDLREGLPQLEVVRQRTGNGDESFVFQLVDDIRPAPLTFLGTVEDGVEDLNLEIERRNSHRVVRDAPDRARLLRLNPAQRRVAELVSQKWAVPVQAKAELDAALKVLAGHFQLHSDASAGQEVASESRLRAVLSPQGEGLQLRLLAQPFGDFGPLVEPGHGRERLLALHEGLNLATRRDLKVEASHLQSVLDALPALSGAETAACTWLLAEPEQALAVLEQLPQLPAVAGVDWPRGKPVRVQPVAAKALQISVKSNTDWLGLQGELQLEEGRVISLQRLLQMAHESRRGRFVALGEGDYLALSEQLKRQLADLHALAQAEGQGIKLPAAAASWLADTLDESMLKGDKAWQKRLLLLDEAATLRADLPSALQADLRSYQAEGFAWMTRLAHAGLGACLADDMGLGKTVQTLALLLQRAEQGPALVLAPTSVCSNWVDEAARFAPGLRVHLYGESERSAMLQGLAAGDLLVASYALLQIDSEAFAAQPWATLVLDEAQALKNAATKRAKAVAALQADFRLALTGTPVENRLADLWSIMNLLNPGLLGSSTRFNERFATPIERDRDEAARGRLRRLVSPFLLRRTKAQVLSDLPPRTEIIHRVQPGPEERAFLEASRRGALQRVAEAAAANAVGAPGGGSFHVLTELTRLRRAACDPRLVAPELGLVGAKAHEFEQLATELVAGRHKALVFSQFTDFLKLLGERLDAVGLKYQYLDGSTPAAERGKRVAAFQRGEGDLFLISLKAGGFGLNLTAADYVLIVDPWWNPAAEDQALGRAHRMGQTRPVTVYRLVTAGSVEERIVALHRDKRVLADGILDGQDDSTPLAAEDLRELLLGD